LTTVAISSYAIDTTGKTAVAAVDTIGKTLSGSYLLQFAIVLFIVILGIAIMRKLYLFKSLFGLLPPPKASPDNSANASYLEPPITFNSSKETKDPPWI